MQVRKNAPGSATRVPAGRSVPPLRGVALAFEPARGGRAKVRAATKHIGNKPVAGIASPRFSATCFASLNEGENPCHA